MKHCHDASFKTHPPPLLTYTSAWHVSCVNDSTITCSKLKKCRHTRAITALKSGLSVCDSSLETWRFGPNRLSEHPIKTKAWSFFTSCSGIRQTDMPQLSHSTLLTSTNPKELTDPGSKGLEQVKSNSGGLWKFWWRVMRDFFSRAIRNVNCITGAYFSSSSCQWEKEQQMLKRTLAHRSSQDALMQTSLIREGKEYKIIAYVCTCGVGVLQCLRQWMRERWRVRQREEGEETSRAAVAEYGWEPELQNKVQLSPRHLLPHVGSY